MLVAIVDSNSLPQCGRELVGPLMAEFAEAARLHADHSRAVDIGPLVFL